MKNYDEVLDSLSKSKFRSSFKLKSKDIEYINDKGIEKIKSHAYDFINKSIQVYLAYHNGNMLKYIQAKHKIDNKELGFTKEMLAKLYEEGGIDEKDNDDVS